MSEQAETMHDALSEAFDEAEAEAPDVSEQPPSPASTAFVAPEIEPVQKEVPADHKIEGTIKLPDSADTGGAAPDDNTAKAPQSWGVTEREGWGTLSPEIQNQINKRESEIQQALTHSGEARKFHEEFNQAVTPYLGFIQAEGGTPMSAFSNLMQTAATLQAGAPQQKAQRIAELINHYGVDLRTLDSLLAGQTVDNDESRLGQMLDQRLQPMMQTLNQFQQSQVTQNQQTQDQQNFTINEFFTQNEFAGDVRFEMADLMEMAGKRGQSLDLPGAYEKALLLRPDIQQVIEQRKAAANAQTNNRNIQAKSNAAVSVAGGDALQTGAPKPGSMREAIEAAMDQ